MAKMTVQQVEALKSKNTAYKKNVDTGLQIRVAVNGIKICELFRIEPAIETYYLGHGRFPDSTKEAGIGTPKNAQLENIESMVVSDKGVVTVKFATFPGDADAWISYTPTYAPTVASHGIGFIWRCESGIHEIEKMAPNCQQIVASAKPARAIPVVAPSPTTSVAATSVPIASVPATAVARLDCEVLKHSIETRLVAKGVKNYQLDILASSEATTSKIIGHCNGGSGKITYSRSK